VAPVEATKPAEPVAPAEPDPSPTTAAVARALRDSAPTLAHETRSPFASRSSEIEEPRADSPLAGAFTEAVKAAEPELGHTADEWFVGINGVPVGPIKLAELRSKAASRAVTRDSLVWRDGFEEWKPLGTFPELVAIVEESTSSARASYEPFEQEARTGLAGAMPRWLLEAATAAGSVRVATAETAVTIPASVPASGAQDMDELEQLAGLQRKSGLSFAQVFAMAVAILFGLTVGFVVFSGTEKTREVVKYVQVPTEAEKKPDEPTTNAAEAEKAGETPEVAAPTKGTGVAKSTKTASTGGDKQTGLKGLSGLSGLAAGPGNGPGSQATESTAGRPLDSAAVQGTVRRYTSSVKRSCWQPALDTRDANAPTSARVSVTITVSGSGAVQNVSTSGDPRGYRGLATCIARRVQGWQFPPSSGQTTVNVPFVFAAQ
jgi:hypothetical protein